MKTRYLTAAAWFWAILFALILAACMMPEPNAAPTIPPERTTFRMPPTPTPNPLPLTEVGPYYVGIRQFSAEDASRQQKPIGISVWYPAQQPQTSTSASFIPNAPADFSGAPYPLILSSTKIARDFAPYLVTHGFVWASVNKIDTYSHLGPIIIDQPLDILFALEQVATKPPEELIGMIDADRAGAIGYSFDGNNALILGGARINPDHYHDQCAHPETLTLISEPWWIPYVCGLVDSWDEFATHAGTEITDSEDGLWQPISDERIRAVIPMAGEGVWLFGEEGLAALHRPVLFIVASDDLLYPENVLLYEQAGSPDKTLISFVDHDHMMIYEPHMVARMAHFIVAFFGAHLQDRPDLAQYYSQEFVSQYDDIQWGPPASR